MVNSWARLRHRLWRTGQLVVVLGAIAAAVYWTQFAPVTVTAFTVQRGEIVAEVMGTGTLESHISATISPKISGLITAVLVDQGDRAEAGQVLVRLDDGDFSRQVEVAESTLGAANAAVERQKADRARTLAVLDQARYDYDRVENLVKQNTAATTEFQEATKALRVAEADVARADAALVEVQKQVIAAEKTLEYQKAKLSDTVVRAPCAGLIVRRDRDPGDVVVPGSSMLFLVSTDELWISAWVDETEMARLKPEQPARVAFREEAGRSYAGQVARLGREVDRETREFLVDVRVRELPENWAVGQRAEVYIETGHKTDVVLLPTRFVVWRDGKAGTFVERDGHAAWSPLRLGLRGRESVEVVEGLSEGERAIIPAAQAGGLKPGQRVAATPTGDQGPAGKQP
jgi:HlyD family secretion protein